MEMPEQERNQIPKNEGFFDLSDYFEAESQRLTQAGLRIKKQITTGGETEEKIVQTLDFEKELSVFSKSNINKVALLDKYRVDSTLTPSNELAQLVYIAQDKKLKTKKLLLDFENGVVKNVQIQNASGSALAEFEQELSYQPDKGYTIASRQDILFFEDKTMKVEATFLKE